MQRSTEGAGAGATVAEVLIGRVAIQVVQIGAHGAHKIRKSAHLEVLSPGLAGRQSDGGIAPATLAEEGIGAEGEARRAPAAFLRGLRQGEARRDRKSTRLNSSH